MESILSKHQSQRTMSFLERIEQKIQDKQNNPAPANDNDRAVDYEFFGIEAIRNPLPCIVFRIPDSDWVSLPYSLIVRIHYNPSRIIIKTTDSIITITGRDLQKLFDYLAVYRVRYIQPNIGIDISDEGLFVSEVIIDDIC